MQRSLTKDLSLLNCVFTQNILNFLPLNTEFDGMMRKSTHFHRLGLGVLFLTFILSSFVVKGQGVPNAIKNVTNTVTAPMNTTQQVTKEVVQPIKDVRTDVKTVTNAPKEITREVDQTKKAFESAGNEVDRAKSDLEKVTGTGDNKKESEKDSTAAKTADANSVDGKSASDGKAQEADAKFVPPDYVPEKKATPTTATKVSGFDPRDVPRPVPPGSRDNKTPSGPMPAETAIVEKKDPDQGVAPKVDLEPNDIRTSDPEASDNKGANSVAGEATVDSGTSSTIITNPAAEYTSVSVPPSTKTADPSVGDGAAMGNSAGAAGANEAASAASATSEQEGKYVALTPVAGEGTKRPKPDYSLSPARIALEKAEFDIETLEQLFKYSNWEGLEREHTVRAVEYALNEMQLSIVEIKKLDPGFSTWRFEERYKEMRAAYQKAKQP